MDPQLTLLLGAAGRVPEKPGTFRGQYFHKKIVNNVNNDESSLLIVYIFLPL